MEQQRKTPKVSPAVSGGQGYGGDDGPATGGETVADIDRALGKVTIIHGANEVAYEVAGKPVSYVREALSAVLTIPKDAQALVNGQPVSSENGTLLTQNDTLEFIKASGVKG